MGEVLAAELFFMKSSVELYTCLPHYFVCQGSALVIIIQHVPAD